MTRLRSIELWNFKNVEQGKIQFGDIASGASITGIYGQNGSGKTAVIDALEVIDRVFSGSAQADHSGDFIGRSSNFVTVAVALDVEYFDEGVALVEYEATLMNNGHGALNVMSESVRLKTPGEKKRVLVEHIWNPRVDDVGVSANWSYAPKGRWRTILGAPGVEKLIYFAEGSTLADGRSFLFSKAFSDALERFTDAVGGDSEIPPQSVRSVAAETVTPLRYVLTSLKLFSLSKLHVLSTARTSVVSLNVLFLSSAASGKDGFHQLLRLDVDNPCNLSKEKHNVLLNTVDTVNQVLGALVPGFVLSVRELGGVVLDSGEDGRRVELMSVRDGREIPFRCESEGIKKIVSIVALLVDVYNDPESCLVVDELDSGIFEFLLGELLEVFADGGKGQLIFTAHNLRALETLPAGCLVFTTTNQENRFVRFKGVKPSNNLRDLYLRTVNLGGQDEEIYRHTDRLSIGSALWRAGHPDEPSFDELLAQVRG